MSNTCWVKECPRCGESEHLYLYEEGRGESHVYAVKCGNCHFIPSLRFTLDGAVRDWNAAEWGYKRGSKVKGLILNYVD